MTEEYFNTRMRLRAFQTLVIRTLTNTFTTCFSTSKEFTWFLTRDDYGLSSLANVAFAYYSETVASAPTRTSAKLLPIGKKTWAAFVYTEREFFTLYLMVTALL